MAAWYDRHAAFVLGAMLPDFLSMLGSARARALTLELSRGITLHHATDAAFHAIPAFVRLVAEARMELSARGLGRGAARATAHIGVELLLDEVLLEEGSGRGGYLAALEFAMNRGASLEWAAKGDEDRLLALVRALAERGASAARADASRVAARVRRALAPHPRLAFAEHDEARVADWVVAAREPVVGCSEVIVTELRSRLEAAGY